MFRVGAWFFQAEVDRQALSYLMTAVIHRMYETDPEWWCEFLGEIRAERSTAGGDVVGGHVLDWPIGIVAHDLKPQRSMGGDHGQ